MKKQKGNRAMRKKKYPKAIKYYTKAIKVDPKNPTYHLNRAIANANLDLWKDAETDAAHAIDFGSPPSAKSHYQHARAQLRRGHCEKARNAICLGIAAYPNETALLQLQKEIEQACKRLEAERQRANEEANTPAAEGPNVVRMLLERARSEFDKDTLKAIGTLQEARAIAAQSHKQDTRRDEIGVMSLLGKANVKMKRWSDASEVFQEVVTMQEATYSLANDEERQALSNAHNNLGICQKNDGKLSQAIESLDRAYHLATNGDDKVATPEAGQILQNIGKCLQASRRFSEAEVVFVRALDVGKRAFGEDHASHALNYVCIARCQTSVGKVREAIEAYSHAMMIWTRKDLETCLKEMPDVPNKDRLLTLQQSCRDELGALVVAMEQARQHANNPQNNDLPTADNTPALAA